MTFSLDLLAGTVCGVLSGFGLGGGSLLLIYMSHMASLDQTQAQGINLIYFIPTAAASLIFHLKNKLVSGAVFLLAAVPGIVMSVMSALAATFVSPQILRKFFGIFLLATGVKMFIKKDPASGTGESCKHK